MGGESSSKRKPAEANHPGAPGVGAKRQGAETPGNHTVFGFAVYGLQCVDNKRKYKKNVKIQTNAEAILTC